MQSRRIKRNGRESKEGGGGMRYEGEGEKEREEGYMRKGEMDWWVEWEASSRCACLHVAMVM